MSSVSQLAGQSLEPGLPLAQPSFHSTLATVLRKRPTCPSSKGTGDICKVKGWAERRQGCQTHSNLQERQLTLLQRGQPQVSLLTSPACRTERPEGAGDKHTQLGSTSLPQGGCEGGGWQPGTKVRLAWHKGQGPMHLGGEVPRLGLALLARSGTFYT